LKKRKTFTKDFKACVALDAVKGQKTIGELATEYGVHPNQIGQWKKTLLKDSAELFSRSKDRDIETHEAEKERLYQQIGKLQVELEWLKKTAGYRR
jgi:transposase-like protein